MRVSDQYIKIVEWSEEDRCYVGTCPGLMLGGVHGQNEAKEEFCHAVEEWIDIYEKDKEPLPAATAGKDYSGKFVVRVDKDLYKALALNALCHGESLNSYCVKLLREESAHHVENKGTQRSVRRRVHIPLPENADPTILFKQFPKWFY